jgi:hypothetical protein
MRAKSLCASLLVVMSAAALQAAALQAAMAGSGKDELAQVVNGFYTVHQQSSQDGIPDAKQRAKYQPYVSPELNKLLADADAAEVRYANANPDSPPMMEGDLFSPNFEGISSFKLGACTTKGAAAQCKMHLRYVDAHPRPQDKPVDWTDTVALEKTAAGWRVGDIAYGGTWDFGNHGTLRAILKDMIASAGK